MPTLTLQLFYESVHSLLCNDLPGYRCEITSSAPVSSRNDSVSTFQSPWVGWCDGGTVFQRLWQLRSASTLDLSSESLPVMKQQNCGWRISAAAYTGHRIPMRWINYRLLAHHSILGICCGDQKPGDPLPTGTERIFSDGSLPSTCVEQKDESSVSGILLPHTLPSFGDAGRATTTFAFVALLLFFFLDSDGEEPYPCPSIKHTALQT